MADATSGADLAPVVNTDDMGPSETTTTSTANSTAMGSSVDIDMAHDNDANDASDLFIPYQQVQTINDEPDENANSASSTRGNQHVKNMWADIGEDKCKPFSGVPYIKAEEAEVVGVILADVIDLTEDGGNPGKAQKRKRNAQQFSDQPKSIASKKFKDARQERLNVQSLGDRNFFADVRRAEGVAPQREFEASNTRHDVWAVLKRGQVFKSRDDERNLNADIQLLKDALHNLGVPWLKPADGGKWWMPGLLSTLHHHQLIALDFMVKREVKRETLDPPFGGFIADQMGLGKTVMALALVVRGRNHCLMDSSGPGPYHRRSKATLVVCPSSIVNQWYDEIAVHCQLKSKKKKGEDGELKIFKGSISKRCKYNSKITVDEDLFLEQLADNDIIIASYAQVLGSYPTLTVPDEYTDPFEREAWLEEHRYRCSGHLHLLHLHRIILDEAHYIRNVETRISQACMALRSDFRWAVTGTPMTNGVSDLYALFVFIGVLMAVTNIKDFKRRHITGRDDKSDLTLNKILQECMLQRYHGSKFLNANLVSLPATEFKVLKVDFNEFERKAYKLVEQRFIESLNRMSWDGEEYRGNGNLFAMITYLRQMTAHPFMPQSTMYKMLHREDLEQLQEIVEAYAKRDFTKRAGTVTLWHIRRALESNAGTRDDQDRLVVDFGEHNKPLGQPPKDSGGDYGLSYDPGKYLDKIKAHQKRINSTMLKCAKCKNKASEPQLTSCNHIYCMGCLDNMQNDAAFEGLNATPCRECKTMFTSVMAVPAGARERLARDLARGIGQDGLADKELSWWDEGEILPSPKGIAVKAQIQSWLKASSSSSPAPKVILFTQWRAMSRILHNMCEVEGWRSYLYSGDMDQDTRSEQLELFKQDGQILICGLKVGSLGLNLTMASRVICIDPW